MDERDLTSSEESAADQMDAETDLGANADGVTEAVPTEIDLSKLSAEEILAKHDGIKKLLQSQKDKEVAAERRRLLGERQRQDTEAKRQREEDELRNLEASEDYEGIGKREAEKRRTQGAQEKLIREVGAAFETAVATHEEFSSLGETEINRVYQEVFESKGNLMDFVVGLHRSKMEKELSSRMADFKAEMAKEVEAKLAEHGLESRTKNDEEGNAGSLALAGGGVPMKLKSRSEFISAYANGDITEAQLKKAVPDFEF